MAKVLVVNSNSSASATAQIEAGCKPYIPAGAEVDFITAEAGPEGIDTPLDVALSGLESVRAIVRYEDDYDAFIVACGNDPGLDVARQVTDKPVVGIAEAGILFALMLGAKFSPLTLLRSEIPMVEEMVQRYGVSSRMASVATLDVSAGELIGGSAGDPYQLFADAARRAKEEDMAEVVVLVGSVMAGLQDRLTEDIGIPVVSGMVCAIRLAGDMAALGMRTSRAFKYSTPEKSDRLVGYPDFQAVYGASEATAGA
ncbi:MAG TPA: aspartate/glutamate racemase family protein [Solirubrobacterales bacterium]|jgi:allantoin racemase